MHDTTPQTADGKALWHFSMSLDGFVAGTGPTLDTPPHPDEPKPVPALTDRHGSGQCGRRPSRTTSKTRSRAAGSAASCSVAAPAPTSRAISSGRPRSGRTAPARMSRMAAG